MELIQYHTSTQSFKPFGQVTGGSIRLRTWSKASSYGPNHDPSERLIYIFIRCVVKIRGKLKIGNQRKKEINIRAGDACLDDFDTEKSNGDCTLIGIAEYEVDRAKPNPTIYVLMSVED